MKLENLTYQGPELNDPDLLDLLPESVASLLKQINGFIQFHGGFHLFGACLEPSWHSLRESWQGEHAAHRHYEQILEDDVPFGEDCLGFQYLLRDGKVIYLDAQTGAVEFLDFGLLEFFEWIEADAVENLGMQPLLQVIQEGNVPEPGQLVSEYPPFCASESEVKVSLSLVASAERRKALIDLHQGIRSLREGEKLHFKIVK